MKNNIKNLSIAIGLIVLALVIYFKPICGIPNICTGYSPDCYPSREVTVPDQKEEIDEMLKSLKLTFDIEKADAEQIFFIGQKKNKNFVILASYKGEEKKPKKIKNLRFTLVNGEGSYYEIDHVSQPVELDTDENHSRKLVINFKLKQRSCSLPFIPRWYNYTIKDEKYYLEKGDIVVHKEGFHNIVNYTAHQKDGEKIIEVGEHICEITFK